VQRTNPPTSPASHEPEAATEPAQPENRGRLEVSEISLGESAPVAVGFVIALPFLATPWLLKLLVQLFGNCSTDCASTQHGGLWLLEKLVGAGRLPQVLITTPVLADAAVGAAVMVVVIQVLAACQVPILAGFAPILKVTQRIKPRTGAGFDFVVKSKGRPHRVMIHLGGTFAGYPGDAFVSLKLQDPTGSVQQCERTVRPISVSTSTKGVADYIFDPIYFQFTPELAGNSHLWVGYGVGPECRMRLAIQRRS